MQTNCRSQIDFVDMQMRPNGDYKCVYQDHFATFVIIWRQRSENNETVTNILLSILTFLGGIRYSMKLL